MMVRNDEVIRMGLAGYLLIGLLCGLGMVGIWPRIASRGGGELPECARTGRSAMAELRQGSAPNLPLALPLLLLRPPDTVVSRGAAFG